MPCLTRSLPPAGCILPNGPEKRLRSAREVDNGENDATAMAVDTGECDDPGQVHSTALRGAVRKKVMRFLFQEPMKWWSETNRHEPPQGYGALSAGCRLPGLSEGGLPFRMAEPEPDARSLAVMKEDDIVSALL